MISGVSGLRVLSSIVPTKMVRITLLSGMLAAGCAFWAGAATWPFSSDSSQRFTPAHKLVGVGLDRNKMSDEVLEKRTELMIESQTFAILRDPRALAGAKRITSAPMQRIFKSAAAKSGIRASLIAAIAYLESYGASDALSPTGPKGVMQISAGTARSMGLRQVYARRYKTVTVRKRVKTKRGHVVRSVRKRVPYSVLVRDDRMRPQRAIPAAASYLARLEDRFGGIDWAIFAYHCGEGCAASMKALLENAKGVEAPYTVPKLFFSGSPVRNRELYEAVQREMARDYSPTYYFRVLRAEQLLEMYRTEPAKFQKLFEQYRYAANPAARAPHRLTVWLTEDDLAFQSCDDLKRAQGDTLARVFDDPQFFGFRLRKDEIAAIDPENTDYYLQATPSAIGALAYISYETRRLYEAMKSKEGKFVPLEVTSLVQPMSVFQNAADKGPLESLQHCSGQVFDIDYSSLPVSEREALDFVLADMGWHGFLGFIEETAGRGVLHIGPSPSARDFFTKVYEDAVRAKASLE
jgi:hypothetical protein